MFFSVRTLSAAGVTGAIVSLSVVMMIAVKIAADRERTLDESFCRIFHVAGSSADNFYSRLSQGIDGTAADTAADEDINSIFFQQGSQSAVSGAAAVKKSF